MTTTRLLIVEDDEDIRAQMQWALGNDYEVLTAADRAGALAAFTAHRPLVTLLDLGLPPRPNDRRGPRGHERLGVQAWPPSNGTAKASTVPGVRSAKCLEDGR